MAEIAVLRHEEGVRLDPDSLLALYAELGEAGAEAVVCRAMEDLAARLAEMRRLAMANDLQGLSRNAALLSRVAAQVGMTTLSRVGRDVQASAAAGDALGLAATLARLLRIGDRSLTAVWDLRDMTL